MKQVTTLRLYGPRDLARIEACVVPLVQSWAGHWLFGNRHVVSVKATPVVAKRLGRRMRCIGDPSGAWLGRCRSDAVQLADLLFGESISGSERSKLVVRVADRVAEELAHALLAGMLGQADAAADSTWKQAAEDEDATAAFGLVHLRISVASASMDVVASAAACVAVLAAEESSEGQVASPALVQRSAAIGDSAVGLRASLAEVEIGLFELLSMRPGDVVLFPHPLVDPVFVKTQDGKPVGRAVLGSREGRRAAQFIERNTR